MQSMALTKGFFLLVALACTSTALFVGVDNAHAQAPNGEVVDVVRVRVERVLREEERRMPGTDTVHTIQTLEGRVLTGTHTNEVVEVSNDFLSLEEGDVFFATYHVDVGGVETFYVQDVDRRAPLAMLIVLFAVSVIAFGGWYGARALVSLGGSLFVIGYVLVPGLLDGWHPLVACFLVAVAVLALAIFLTHGLNRESAVAFLGTLLGVAVTVFLAARSVSWTHLSGFGPDESVYLNVSARGSLDLVGLLIGGIIIGALGVLDDIAITQVGVVRELLSASTLSRRAVFLRALRVGREHVGAVVNTLALAYVGVSLPLILLLYQSPTSLDSLMNMEVLATELVRTAVGSFGIILTVPLVTALAAWKLARSATASQGNLHHTHRTAHSH